MLSNFRPQESFEYPGEVAIYADDDSGRTVFCIVSRDALSDIWGTHMLDARVTRRLVAAQIDKFSRVMSAKYAAQPGSFAVSSRLPEQLRSVLAGADFRASGESFPMSDLEDAMAAGAPGDII